jgi:L-ribulokinase
MFAAVAAGVDSGGYATVIEASRHMARLRDESYRPNPDHRAAYDELYREYVRLHDLFGRGDVDVMKTLRRLRRVAGRAAAGSDQPAAAIVAD